jgi:hypothetical protein
MGRVLRFPYPTKTASACSCEAIAARFEHQLQAMVRELEMTLILNEASSKLQRCLRDAGVLMTEARVVLRLARK